MRKLFLLFIWVLGWGLGEGYAQALNTFIFQSGTELRVCDTYIELSKPGDTRADSYYFNTKVYFPLIYENKWLTLNTREASYTFNLLAPVLKPEAITKLPDDSKEFLWVNLSVVKQDTLLITYRQGNLRVYFSSPSFSKPKDLQFGYSPNEKISGLPPSGSIDVKNMVLYFTIPQSKQGFAFSLINGFFQNFDIHAKSKVGEYGESRWLYDYSAGIQYVVVSDQKRGGCKVFQFKEGLPQPLQKEQKGKYYTFQDTEVWEDYPRVYVGRLSEMPRNIHNGKFLGEKGVLPIRK
jgi:hypothetical protein